MQVAPPYAKRFSPAVRRLRSWAKGDGMASAALLFVLVCMHVILAFCHGALFDGLLPPLRAILWEISSMHKSKP